MAAISTPTAVAGGRGVTGGLTRILRAVRAWHDARITRNALSRLTDRELDDIGLVRGDIDNLG